jgi:DNA replication protein DnaC
LEIVEERTGLRATIFTSQLPITQWHEALAEPTIADALLDRVSENLRRIDLHGESMRRQQAAEDSAADAKQRSANDSSRTTKRGEMNAAAKAK